MMRRKNWRAWAFLGMICLLLSGSFAFGREVELEELNISLYNKPVTGFRVLLDRSERFVSNQIISHVAAEDPTPAFQYQHSIIFENIRYKPITQEHDLSLYFLLKSLQGQFTELTVVAMYDYRRSINSRDFPELSHNLKIDLARFVRHTTGDIMRAGDVLYDDAMLAQLKAIPDPIPDSAEDDPKVTHYAEEEVDNASILINKDPFEAGKQRSAEGLSQNPSDTTIQRLNRRIEALLQREQDLMATERSLRNEQSNMQRQQEMLLEKVKASKALRDSIAMLNQRVEALLGQNYVADDVSVSSETAYELAALEKENNRLLRNQERLNKENDSLRKVAQVYGEQLGRLAAGGKTTAEEMSRISAENKSLARELQEYKARQSIANDGPNAATADSLLQVVAEANIRNASLKQDLERMHRENGRLSEDNDFLSGKKMQLEERIITLDAENKSMRDGSALVTAPPDNHLLDSLNAAIRNERRIGASIKSEMATLKSSMAESQATFDRQNQELAASKKQQKLLESEITRLQNASGQTARTSENPANTKSTTQMRDSIVLLQQQLNLAENRIFELSRGQQALSEAQSQLQIKELSLRKLQTEYDAINNQLNDNQKRNDNLKKSLDAARAELAANQKASSSTQEETKLLQQQLNNLKVSQKQQEERLSKANGEIKTLNDTIRARDFAQNNLYNEIYSRDKRIAQQAYQRDSLTNRLNESKAREANQQKTIATLQTRIDSLSSQQMPVGDQQKFVREQWAKLTQWEKELKATAENSANKEKLLNQREQNFNQKEADFAAREKRVQNLEEKEKRLAMLEQQLNAREGVGTADLQKVNVREGRVVEYGRQVSVFIAESNLNPRQVQKQIVAYMLSRDEFYQSQFPELVYVNSNLAEVDTEPIEMKVRIDSKGTGAILQISFKLTTGEYLGVDNYRERIEPTKQLIAKMLRYKL